MAWLAASFLMMKASSLAGALVSARDPALVSIGPVVATLSFHQDADSGDPIGCLAARGAFVAGTCELIGPGVDFEHRFNGRAARVDGVDARECMLDHLGRSQALCALRSAQLVEIGKGKIVWNRVGHSGGEGE